MYRKELISFLICFLSFFLIASLISKKLLFSYKENFLQSNASIINGILEEHPELEYEIISILQDSNQDFSFEFLEKYGFSDFESLSYLPLVSRMEQNTKWSLFLAFGFCFFLFLAIVLYFYFQKQKRIQEINDYLFRVLQNDYQMNLKDYQEDSISILKNDLMKVTNKLRCVSEISVADKKNLERTLSDISHQLRTPLTSLYVINDVLSTDSIPEKEKTAFLQQQKEQLERMEWLIVTLLKMSQIDSGTIEFQRKPEFLWKIVEDALKPSLIPLELKQIHYEVDIARELVWNLDYRWTVEALVNLIKNATEHTFCGGTISITAIDNPMYVEVVVQDTGTGIKKEDLPHIFERFYKGNTKSESIGIGLNLSKTIIEKQDGTIHVESEEGEGTKFIIHFYKVTI